MRLMRCCKCGEDFELRPDHKGYANQCLDCQVRCPTDEQRRAWDLESARLLAEKKAQGKRQKEEHEAKRWADFDVWVNWVKRKIGFGDRS
jgi:hypothetical protein